MNDQYSFEPTVLHIEKVNSCTDESSSSDRDNSLQIENFINLDDEFSLKFSKMTTDNKFKFFCLVLSNTILNSFQAHSICKPVVFVE